MKEKYYISSNKYALYERQTKNYGKVYDLVFRVVDPITLLEKQKKMSGYKTKTLAKEAYTAFITENCELRKNIAIRKNSAQKSDFTVGDLIPLYLAAMVNQTKESTMLDRRNVYNIFILPYFKDYKMKNLSKQEIKIWQDKIWSSRQKNGNLYSYEYLSKIRMHFSAFLSWAEETYDFPNHLKEVKKPKRVEAKKEMQIWTREEFGRFISCVDDPLYHCLFTMLFFTGRRKGEVLALRKSNVFPDKIVFDKTYTRKTTSSEPYKLTSTKNRKIGYSPVSAPLSAELRAFPGNSPFFFGGSAPIHENTVAYAFDRYIRKSGVRKIRMHDLRHSFVSMIIHLGASIPTVANLIGDTQEQIVKTYSHIYENDVQNIIGKIK